MTLTRKTTGWSKVHLLQQRACPSHMMWLDVCSLLNRSNKKQTPTGINGNARVHISKKTARLSLISEFLDCWGADSSYFSPDLLAAWVAKISGHSVHQRIRNLLFAGVKINVTRKTKYAQSFTAPDCSRQRFAQLLLFVITRGLNKIELVFITVVNSSSKGFDIFDKTLRHNIFLIL